MVVPQGLPLSPAAPVSVCATDKQSKECIQELIRKYADLYGVPEELALDVADCESQFRADAHGDGGRAYGPFQFHKKTFEMFSKKFGAKLDYHDTEDNIKLAVWAMANARGRHWSCYRKIAMK